jgi:diadenosine tetraphosphate (Ap4A) HIT family hydrolase
MSDCLIWAKGAEHVYAAVIGHGVDHFHRHVIPRYPGTPGEYRWTRVDEQPDAPRGDARGAAALVERLRADEWFDPTRGDARAAAALVERLRAVERLRVVD